MTSLTFCNLRCSWCDTGLAFDDGEVWFVIGEPGGFQLHRYIREPAMRGV